MKLRHRLVDAVCRFITKHRPGRMITRDVDDPYIERCYLWKRSGPHGFSVFLHRFHRSDEDEELHSHPWHRSWSLILLGGYREERRLKDGSIAVRELHPGDVNRIGADDFHRVDIRHGDPPCWTLFVAGAQTGRSWGFLDGETNEFVPHAEFLSGHRRRGESMRRNRRKEEAS